jgi:glycosyltransferase 2 family protein
LNPAHERVQPLAVWRRWLPRILRLVIALIVALGVGKRLWSEHERLSSLTQHIQFSWLAVAGITYIAGLSTCAFFWWWSIRDQGDRPGVLPTWTAYFAGHLGKYVPGKGLVVVIRAALLRDSHVSLATGAISCAHETLLMMATGALVAVVLLPIVAYSSSGYLLATSLVMLGGLGIPALPPAVSLWSRLVTRSFPKGASVVTYQCRWSTVCCGALLIAGGWFLMGLSLVAVLQSMQCAGELIERRGLLGSVGLLTAIVALATVGGFLSFLPGGLGSREWILVETLGPALGLERTGDAAVAALLLRVVWIVSELVGTGVFWLLDRPWNNRQAETP